ncbi:hypothetical protein [Streptomyces sp. NBC_01579]|uniref:hypothetical protein n=1 Tax=Streptomyces sp. NBC_01579 TaxID=2975885 RepID=UPI00386CD3EA
MTPLLKRLQANGLIRRERQVDDEHLVQITLAQQGVELRERARPTSVARGRAAGFTARDTKEVKSFLERLTANVSAC